MNGAHEKAPVEQAGGSAFYPCGGDDDLVRHLLAPGFLERQQAATYMRRRSSEGGRPRFKGGTSPSGASLLKR